jgi:hypothetical protein
MPEHHDAERPEIDEQAAMNDYTGRLAAGKPDPIVGEPRGAEAGPTDAGTTDRVIDIQAASDPARGRDAGAPAPRSGPSPRPAADGAASASGSEPALASEPAIAVGPVQEPSQQTSIGMFLAVIAGLTALGSVIWPIVPVATMGSGPWWLLTVAIGAAFLVAAALADRRAIVAKVILGVGALILAASAAIFGGLLANLFGGQTGVNSALLYLVPAAIAAVAAALIEPAAGEASPRG